MITKETRQIANFFGANPKDTLFINPRILISEKRIIVCCTSNYNNQDTTFKFYVNKRHEILTELINQKFNR